MKKFGILGSGTWGTALANMLASINYEVTCWSINQVEVDQLNKTHKHIRLPNTDINPNIVFTSSLEDACKDKDFVIFAVPSPFIRETAVKAKKYLLPSQILITVAKGVESGSLMTMSEIIKDELGQEYKVVALSGPTHAEEVAIGIPTLIVSACEDLSVAELVRNTISNEVLRVYSNVDIKGVEIAGALKNVIALAAGMSDGMGFGDNTKAAIVTRGLTEMTRLGKAMGCTEQTFYGLTGIGDIVVTATSNFSRNHNAGVLLAKGYSLEDTKKEIGMAIEGINALHAAKELEEKYNVEMPIVNAVYSVIYEGIDPHVAVRSLFTRNLKHE